MFLRIVLSLLVILFILPLKLFAEYLPDPSYISYNTEDGLSNSIVYAIAQDSSGYMWFGTEDGLNRFDGHNFKIYKYSPTDEHSLSGNKISQIYLAPDNQLWIATNNGLSKYIEKTNSFENYRVTNGLSNNVIQAILKVKNQLWVGTDDGLNVINLTTNEISKLPINKDGSGTSHKWIRSISQQDNYIWIGTWGGGLNRYDLTTKQFKYFENIPENNSSISGNTIHTTYIDKNNELWIGTVGAGINRYMPNCECFKKITPFEEYSNTTTPSFTELGNQLLISTSVGLASKNKNTNYISNFSLLKAHELGNLTRDIRSVFASNDGTVWVGSFQLGVLAIPKNGFGFQSYRYSTSEKNALKSDDINSLYIEDGYLWTGSVGGLFRYPISEAGALGSAEKILDTFTLKIEPTKGGTYWLATNNGLYHIDKSFKVISHHDHTKLIPDIVGEGAALDVIEMQNGDILAANWRGGLTKLIDEKSNKFIPIGLNGNSRAKQANSQIYVLKKDKNNTIWIGTRDGINHLDVESDTLQHYSLQLESNQPKVTVYYIYSHQTKLYLATNNGIYIYNESTDEFTHNPLDLKNNFIQAIVAESPNELWLSTFNGLYKWNIETNQVQSYFAKDGIQSNEFNTKGVAKDNAGNIYFSGIDGVTKIIPNKLNNMGELGLLTWQMNTTAPNEVTVNHDDATVNIYYRVDDYFLPNKHQFRYNLNGEKWINNDNNTEIQLSGLSAGEYQLSLQYKRDGFDWKSAKSIFKIIVLPPWYQSTAAYITYFLFFSLLCYMVYIIRIRNIRHQNKLLEQQVKKQTTEILVILEQKKQLFANISHELRTPITLINAPIEQLASDNSLTKQQHKLATLAKNNGNRLFNLVERILDLSKAEQQERQVHPINIDDILIRYIIAFEPLMQQKQITFENKLSSHAIISADKEDIASVIENLLSNALKYTKPKGWVTLNSTINTTDNEYQLIIENKHTGLTQEQIEKIFNRFERLEQSDSEQGFGLGLSLVKDICHQNQWQITCQSTDKSVIFCLSIKTFLTEENKDSPAQRQLIELASDKKNSPKKVKHSVLIVEDNDELRTFIAELISSDYQVFTASNGQEALNLAIEKIPDLIVSDVMMPKIDGFSLVNALSEHDNTSHIPTILLTAKTDKESQLKGLNIGAVDYITKPFEASHLKLKLKNILERQQKRFASKTKQETSERAIVSERDQKFIERLNQTVEKNYQDNQFSVEKLVNTVAMSERQLQRKLKALFNQTPAEYIRNYRLIKAKELLLAGKSISFVSDSVGFNSSSYFSRSFKNAFSQSPKDFTQGN